MTVGSDDQRWMAAALALAERGRARTGLNPNIGCVLVRDGRVIGRGWTQPSGRPHAEAMALLGINAGGATAYVTLEPCAHKGERGPACADSLIAAGIARVVVGMIDPDPRTNGQGVLRLKSAGISVKTGIMEAQARASMAGWLKQQEAGRPSITLKLATSLDGCIARADGESQWITGDAARAHAHLERARSNAILVGRGTFEADAPRLNVRLPGLEDRAPQRLLLSRGDAPDGWTLVACPEDAGRLDAQYLLIEGGAQTAAAFLKAGLVDRLMLYRAPIVIGAGLTCLGDIGLGALGDAHGQWRQTDTRQLGIDSLEVYEAV